MLAYPVVVFPATRVSIVDGLASSNAERRDRSRAQLATAYWKPVYKYARLKWQLAPALAEDLTQSFFAHVLDRDVLASFDAERGRFRTFLRTCFDRFAVDEHRRSVAKRRGGGTTSVHVDFAGAESELAMAVTADPETIFDAEWLRHLMQRAVDRLRQSLGERKPLYLAVFERFHGDDEAPRYADVAAELGIKVTDVTNWLAYARRELRRIALELLREITASDEDFAAEALEVFGIEVKRPG